MDDGARARGDWGYPVRRPFVLLAVYFAVGTLQLLLTVTHPPLPDTPVRLNLALTGVSVVQFVLTVVAGAAVATWTLPYLVGCGMLVSAVSAAGAAGGQGQLVAGMYLAVLGLFAGYFLSRRAVQVLLVVATVGFGVALVLNRRLDSPGYVVALVLLVVGVTLVVSSLVERLRAAAVLDPLTGALNRRGLAHAAQALHDLDQRRHETTTVVEIDLNGFKAYNDAYGHQAGDDLLVGSVRDWSSVLRHSDVLSRTGGDEFVLLLPATNRTDAEVLLERMRQVNPVEWSAGITDWGPGESLPAVLIHADEAMYRDKVSRRNGR